ncbi:hypothetical protein BDW22DRAFT_1343010 [Trametopsis cervina]|nr:hypothetical protein BDW22DRAFT_1343010 [Trametopsis cervina]
MNMLCPRRPKFPSSAAWPIRRELPSGWLTGECEQSVTSAHLPASSHRRACALVPRKSHAASGFRLRACNPNIHRTINHRELTALLPTLRRGPNRMPKIKVKDKFLRYRNRRRRDVLRA